LRLILQFGEGGLDEGSLFRLLSQPLRMLLCLLSIFDGLLLSPSDCLVLSMLDLFFRGRSSFA
jgi:hypothetical protein